MAAVLYPFIQQQHPLFPFEIKKKEVIKAAGLDWTGECCKRLSIIHTHV
jgi:hypothetical protein